MRNSDSFLKLAIAAILALLLAACGGGGGGGSSASSSATNAAAPTQSVTNTSSSTQVLAVNAVAVTVDSGVSGVPNMPFVSVTVCTPGTTQCQTINHVLVDTGSWGLRVFASQLPASMALPQQQDASGNLLAECMQFFDGYTWGSVRIADVQIGGEKAASLPIQVIDPGYSAVPSNCSSVGATSTFRKERAGNPFWF